MSNNNMTKIALAFVTVLALAAAQDKSADKPAGKVAKDQAEADLINGIGKEPDGAKRLASLEKWSKDYPETQFADERDQIYLGTYQQLQKPREAFDKAVQILSKHPDDFLALSTIIGYVGFLNNGQPSPADLDVAEKASNHVLKDADTIFSDANKPATQTADQWSKMKPLMMPLAQKTIGFVYFQRKDFPRAETELTKTLQMDPTQAQASYMLANALFSQRTQKPEKQPPAFFEFARAAVYDGPNALPAQLRGQINTTVAKYYKTYHGSDEGFDKLLALANTNALPPDGWTLEDVSMIEGKKIEEENKRRAADPMMALWGDLKTGLTGDNADAFFNEHVKEVALPKFKGTLVSTKPELRPKELVLAVGKAGIADCTLKLDEGQTLPGKMEPGGVIEFEGVGTAYTKEPYMLILTVDKAKITGWTGKNAPAAPKKAGGSGAKKKAQ